MAWLLESGMKDHALEAITAFWYPFAFLQREQQQPAHTPVPTLTAKAEALLAIAKLERQISLLRQTFDLDYTPGVAPLTATVATTPAPMTSAPAPLTVQPLALMQLEYARPVISGFESLDDSLLSNTGH